MVRRRVAVGILVAAAVLCVSAALRYRQENGDAGGFVVVQNSTNLDLYGGGPADHRVSAALAVLGAAAVAAGVVVLRRRPDQ